MTTTTTYHTIAHGVQTRRITWSEFYRLRPDLRPANDNQAGRGNLKVQAAPPRTGRETSSEH